MDSNHHNSMIPTSSQIMFNPAAAFQSMFQNMTFPVNNFSPSFGQQAAMTSGLANPFETALQPNFNINNGFSGVQNQNQNWASSNTMPMMVCMMFPMTMNLNNYPQQDQIVPYHNQQSSLPTPPDFGASIQNENSVSGRTVEIVDEASSYSNFDNRSSDRSVTYDSAYDQEEYSSQQHGDYQAHTSLQVPQDPVDYFNTSTGNNRDDEIELIPRDRAMFEFNCSNANYSNLRRISPLRSPFRRGSAASSPASTLSDQRLDQGGLKSILKRRYGDSGQNRSGNRVRFNISDDDDPETEKFTLDTKTKRKGKRRRDPVRKAPVKSASATSTQARRAMSPSEDDGYMNEDESDLDSLEIAFAARNARSGPFRVPQVPRPVTVVTIDDDGFERCITPLWSPSATSRRDSSDGSLHNTCKDVTEIDDDCFEDNWLTRHVDAALAETDEDDPAAPAPSTSTSSDEPSETVTEPVIRFNPFENPSVSGPKAPTGLKSPPRPPPPPIIRSTSTAPAAASVVSDDAKDEDIFIVEAAADSEDIILPPENNAPEPQKEVFKMPRLPTKRPPVPQKPIPPLMKVVIEDPKVDALAANTQKIRDSMNLICKNIGNDPFKIIREVCEIMKWRSPTFFTRTEKIETIRGPETRYKVSAAIGGQLLTPSKLDISIETAQYRSAVYAVNTLRNNFTKYMTSLGLIVPKPNTSKVIKRSFSQDRNKGPGPVRPKMPRISRPFGDNRKQINGKMPNRQKVPTLNTTKPFRPNQYLNKRELSRVRPLEAPFGRGRFSDSNNGVSRFGGSFKGRNW